MGLILDLAVLAIAAVVVGSLIILAWTLGVSAVRAVARGRASVAESRRLVAHREARLTESAASARDAVAAVSRRAAASAARPSPGRPTRTRSDATGDEADA